MKIDLRQLSEGEPSSIIESKEPKGLDLDAPGINLIPPLEIKVEAFKIQDTLDLLVDLRAKAIIQCSRCLSETELSLAKNFRLDYPISKQDTTVDITEDIRQEIMLEYPLRPLCKPDCLGLCVKCGKNLNDGLCNCEGGK